MTDFTTSKYWLDQAVAQILEHFPEGEIVLSSGISPSASYHVGHFREIMTADALTWGVKRAGRQARHIHVVDNFDPLRKRYPFLPESYEQYVGQPICLIPDPFDKCRAEHATYAEHFYQEFEGYAHQMGIVPDEVIRSYEGLYQAGRMTKQFEQVMAKSQQIIKIFEETSNRQLEPDWTPVQVLDENNVFHNAKADEWDKAAGTIAGARYDDGHVKLNWRLDWPARWAVLGVMVEPFSAQEHGAAGSSYDTGVQFAKEIFGITPPIPGARYANIHLLGETTKMSSSKGNLVTPAEALEIMPPEVLRYFVVRSKPDRTLVFDPGLGLYNLIDEFSKVEEAVTTKKPSEFTEAYGFATAGKGERRISTVPFSHLVTVYQAALGNQDVIWRILERTGYEQVAKDQKKIIESELKFVKNWLEKYAPPEVKFTLAEELPQIELSDDQKAFLRALSEADLEKGVKDAQTAHDLIYQTIQDGPVKPPAAFQALYQVLIGQNSGPRAGAFLATLAELKGHDWLVSRLRLEK